MPITPTSSANLAKITRMYSSIQPLVESLYGRYLDEGAYELLDYGKVIQKNLPKGFKVTQMTGRPFGFKFTIGTDAEYAITTNSKTYKWSRTK